MDRLETINECFCKETVEEILLSLVSVLAIQNCCTACISSLAKTSFIAIMEILPLTISLI